MKNKGFTIVEILVAIVILGIIMAIAIPSYINISDKSKKEASVNKVKQIELAAEKWADENNLSSPISIPVYQLINNGYISADEGSDDSVIDPYTEEDIKCNTVNITLEDNIPTAVYTDEKLTDCVAVIEEQNDPNIIVEAYKINDDNSLSELEINTSTNEFGWSNKDVLIVTDTIYEIKENSSFIYIGSGINETKTSNKCEFENKVPTNIENCKNMLIIEEINSIIDLNITIETTEGLKTARKKIKIDNVAPVLDIKVDNTTWINEKREISINTSDGLVGSGIDSVYINTENKIPSGEGNKIDNNGNAIIKEDNGTYYLFTTDKAGNVSNGAQVKVEKVDLIKPSIAATTDNTSWVNKDRDINITASDTGNSPNDSGIINIYVNTKESTSGAELVNNYNELQSLTEKISKDNGTYYLYAEDLVGNISDYEKIEISKVDKTPPEIVISSTQNKITTNVYPVGSTITISCEDKESGLSTSSQSGLTDTEETAQSLSGKMSLSQIKTYIASMNCTNNAQSNTNENLNIKTAEYNSHSVCGVKSYKYCHSSYCGVASYNYCQNPACGQTPYTYSYSCNTSGYTNCFTYNHGMCREDGKHWVGGQCCDYGTVSKTCYGTGYTDNYCHTSACGVASYNYCSHWACGVASYNTCWNNGSQKFS